MSDDIRVDAAFKAWLDHELDGVPEPRTAVAAAVAASDTTPQRHPLSLRLRRLLGRPHDKAGPRDAAPQPETILWAEHPPNRGVGTRAAAPALRSGSGVSLTTAIAALALAVAIGFAATYFTMGPGAGLFGGAAASAVPTAAPQHRLDPPIDGGRDLRVATDDSGHFRSISDAVADAVDGDRIHVAPGTYRDNIRLDKKLTIAGTGGREGVVIMTPEPGVDGAALMEAPVFTFTGVDAVLSGLTVHGPRIGTAIVINGGAPRLDDLIITADGEQRRSNPTQPRQSISFGAGTTATLTNSWTNAFISIEDAARPTLDGNTLQGTCIRISGAAVEPTVRDNVIEGSACPGFSIVVSGGARSVLDHNTITNDPLIDGIRVVGSGSYAEITSHVINGGDYGIWVGQAGEAVVRRSLVSGARTGVAVSDAVATLDTMNVRYNGTGLLIDRGAATNLFGNIICENDADLDMRVEPAVSTEDNAIDTPCPENVASAASP